MSGLSLARVRARLGSRYRRVRPVQQMEAAECGIASLAMVLDFHGSAKSLADLRAACGTSRDGNSAADLLRGARQYGLEARGLRLDPEELGSLQLPAILHWELNHFVVLERHRRGGARIVDPANGRRLVNAETLDRCFSGIALEFDRTDQLQRQPRQHPGVRRYFSELGRLRAPLAFLVVAGVAVQLLGIVSPAVSQLLIDEVIRPAQKQWLAPLLAVLALAAFGDLALRSLHGLLMTRVQGALGFALTEKLGTHLLRLPLWFVESRSRGDLLDRVLRQAGLGGLLSKTVFGVFDLIFVTALTALMLAYDRRLALLTLGIDLGRIVLVRVLREECRQRAGGEIASRAREHALVLEAAACAELIQAFGVEQRVRAWYGRRLAERLHWTVRTGQLHAATGRGLSVFDAMARAVVLLWGGRLVIAGQLTVGVFSGFLAIRALASAPLASLVGMLEGWLGLESTLMRAEDVFEAAPAAEGERTLPAVRGRLELEGIGFRYGSAGAWVFRGVSLTVEPGENVVLVGPSGQGKSTLLRVLAGLLEPTEGRVLLDGVELRHYSRASLAEQVGSLVGDPLVLAESVRENVRLRLPEAAEPALARALELSCFAEVVRRLPHGLDTRLEARGVNLSGGERQRLGLAQALLGEPRVLFLDEATCSLDVATEARVLQNLNQTGATRVSVAHRPAVVRAADRVFEVFEGRVAELPPRARVTRQKAHLTLIDNSPEPRAGAAEASHVG